MVILKPIKWVNDGYTLAYLDNEIYFIKGALPGETVECEVQKQKNRGNLAIVKKVLKSDPGRIDSDCASYPSCGGCSFRHLEYKDELNLKKELFFSELIHKKIFENKEQIEILFKIQSENPIGYRNNVQIKTGSGKKGFFREGTNEIIAIPESGCKNLPDKINQEISKLKNTGKPETIKLRLGDDLRNYEKQEGIFTIRGKKIIVPKNGFFQINQFLIEPWIESILKLLENNQNSILELFCGSGLISLFASGHCQNLFGFEMDKNSIEMARFNAKQNEINNLEFFTKDLYKQNLEESILKKCKFWIVNPPRSGLNPKIQDSIQRFPPDSILYSSCNYQTLVRDLVELKKKGFKIRSMKIFDFFPRTPYFETLVFLEK